jgi:hypothetical protein
VLWPNTSTPTTSTGRWWMLIGDNSFAYKSELRGSANRRVRHASRNDGKAVESLRELSSAKSCQPIGGSSKGIENGADCRNTTAFSRKHIFRGQGAEGVCPRLTVAGRGEK